MLKIAIVITLFAVIASLFSGLYFLLKDPARSERTVNALVVRVSLSAFLIFLLILYFFQNGNPGH